MGLTVLWKCFPRPGQNAAEAGADILFLCQKMQAIDLYGTVDTVICTLDSLNHLSSGEELGKSAFQSSLLYEPTGVFYFRYEYAYISTRIFLPTKHMYTIWNTFTAFGRIAMTQRREGGYSTGLFPASHGRGLYHSSTERFSERAYPVEEVLQRLHEAGFGEVRVYR